MSERDYSRRHFLKTTGLAAAGVASRTNTLFSIPMLFFMAASSHYPHLTFKFLPFFIAVGIILVLEYNGAYLALKKFDLVKKLPAGGKMGPYASVAGVIHCGLGLAVALFLLLDHL